jgi:hypothetical protein
VLVSRAGSVRTVTAIYCTDDTRSVPPSGFPGAVAEARADGFGIWGTRLSRTRARARGGSAGTLSADGGCEAGLPHRADADVRGPVELDPGRRDGGADPVAGTGAVDHLGRIGAVPELEAVAAFARFASTPWQMPCLHASSVHAFLSSHARGASVKAEQPALRLVVSQERAENAQDPAEVDEPVAEVRGINVHAK